VVFLIVDMSSHYTIAAKRHREALIEDGDYRPITPESCVDGATSNSTSQNKRQRAGTGDLDGHVKNYDIPDDTMTDVWHPPIAQVPSADMILRLDVDALREIVTLLVERSADARTLVLEAHARISQTLDMKVYTTRMDEIFDSRSARYTIPGTAYADVKACIADLARQVDPRSPYEVRRDALQALQDIALSILRADRTRQALEVKAHFEVDDCIPQLMLKIVCAMSAQERIRVGVEATVYGSTFMRSLQYLHEKAVEGYVAGFYDFSLVLGALS
jgi:hypothetical protein